MKYLPKKLTKEQREKVKILLQKAKERVAQARKYKKGKILPRKSKIA